MAIFDRTKEPKRKGQHRDFKLWCLGCKKPTSHCFDHTIPIGINTIDLMYECVRCGEQRLFGRENTANVLVGDEDGEVDERATA